MDGVGQKSEFNLAGLQRLPIPMAEPTLDVMLDLYGDVTAASEPRPARAWAILACFAVATSIEALFY